MSGTIASNRLSRDIIIVLKGIQRVAYVASKQGKNVAEVWKQYSGDKSIKEFLKQLHDPRAPLKSRRNVDPLEITKRLLFVGENIITFSGAASKTIYRRATTSQYHNLQYKATSKDGVAMAHDGDFPYIEEDFIDDAQYDEYDDEFEYDISPDKSSLGLIKSVHDFTDRNKIFSAMFVAVPKTRYRSNFIPRKFAVIGEEVDKFSTINQFSHYPKSDSKVSNTFSNTNKLSSSSKSRHVPSSRIARLANFSSLGIGLGIGAIAEASRRAIGLGQQSVTPNSPILSEANVDRIVSTLCGVRGAALKIGQMLSIQDESFLNPELSKLFERVRQSADYMPETQLERVMVQELGSSWLSDNFNEFDNKPFAAASIGQVHLATLKEDGRRVAVKVQYPGVSKGIESDIKNLLGILKVINILPDGLFMDNIIKHMTIELQQECDYEREAYWCTKMKSMLEPYPQYNVPSVIPNLSTKQILTCEYIDGLTIDECAEQLDQKTRNDICLKFVELMLRELFIHRCMQTDPNWANFLYNTQTGKLGLLDFGATREWNQSFVNTYFKIIQGGANGDRSQVLKNSVELGFLTGYENNEMNEAHVNSVMILSEPFRENKAYNFSTTNATLRMQELVPIMLKNRLCPPPPEIYSLHRKMSGLFLMASKLKANINCSQLYRAIENEFTEH